MHNQFNSTINNWTFEFLMNSVHLDHLPSLGRCNFHGLGVEGYEFLEKPSGFEEQKKKI